MMLLWSRNPERKQVTEKDRAYWAFAPLQKNFPQEASIDHFIKAENPAQPGILARRLYFDLTGLPPAPQEVEGFAADTSADAHEKLVDHLLESPRFGERWARHWLDGNSLRKSLNNQSRS